MALYDELKEFCEVTEDEGYTIIETEEFIKFCNKKDRNFAHLVEKTERLNKRHYKKTLGDSMVILSVKEKSFDMFPVAYQTRIEYAYADEDTIDDIKKNWIEIMTKQGYKNWVTGNNKKIYERDKGLLNMYLTEGRYEDTEIVKMYKQSQGFIMLSVEIEKKPSKLTAVITFITLDEIA